jgi:hypothetical protein
VVKYHGLARRHLMPHGFLMRPQLNGGTLGGRMHRQAFPSCTVPGPLDPVPYAHLASRGAIPRKCSQCEHSFEGSCLRAADSLHRYLNLDHGFCGIAGDTEPVRVERSGVPVDLEAPRKCSTCMYLRPDSIRGVVCTKDGEVWGDFSRSLDWGIYAPDVVVPSVAGLQITLLFARLAAGGDDASALQEFRKANPNASIATGKRLCAQVRASIRRPENS